MSNWKTITSSRLRALKRRDEACRLSLDEFREMVYSLAYPPASVGDPRAFWKCHFCGSFLTLETLTLDHYDPLNKGGASSAENLVPCCKSCNEMKATISGKSFQRIQRLLVELAPDEQADIRRRLRRGGQFFHSPKPKVRARA